MNVSVLAASVEFIEQPFVKPMRISSGLISRVTEARVRVRVRAGLREATGVGAIYLSDLWAWPGAASERAAKDPAMRAACERLAATLAVACGGEAAHPLELGLRLHHHVGATDFFPSMPALARAVCASPFDAAIHDATGRTLNRSAFRLYDEPVAIPSADAWFPGEGAAEAIRRLLINPPKRELPAWWIVAADDDLEAGIRPAVQLRGIERLKLKILGRDPAADATRTVAVWRAARGWGIAHPVLCIDANEGFPGPETVLDYLDRIKAEEPAAYSEIQYIEQPSHRDICRYAYDWRAVSARLPLLLDEGLTGLDLLETARAQGWSGLALKTCKGHGFSLVCAAWAARRGMTLALQDLTNPGHAAVHSFLLGAHLPTINGIELNSPQYTPEANRPWLPALSGLFEPRHGRHALDADGVVGLGSGLGGRSD